MKKKDKYIYVSAIVVRTDDITAYFPYNCGSSCVKLIDYTANGQNLVKPHPTFLKYYATYPYWVQVTDDDDWILQLKFMSLEEATSFYDLLLKDPIRMVDMMD